MRFYDDEEGSASRTGHVLTLAADYANSTADAPGSAYAATLAVAGLPPLPLRGDGTRSVAAAVVCSFVKGMGRSER